MIISRTVNNKCKTIIAHRGASGYLPEHTLEAYAMAYGMGANFIEPDIVLSKDNVFICTHNIYLELTTNVSEIFPENCRDDGHWYAIDLDIFEIKKLRVHERVNEDGNVVFPGRFPLEKALFRIPTFSELIELIQGLNKAFKRNVGIIPEIKNPTWHAAEGLPMEMPLISILKKYGFTTENDLLYIQCFYPQFLKDLRLNLGIRLPLIQLIDLDRSFSHMVTQNGLDEIASYSNGIGPHKEHIEKNPLLVKWAHENGLKVLPWVFRADQVPDKYMTFEEELNQFFSTYNIDGLFTDFPDRALECIKLNKEY